MVNYEFIDLNKKYKYFIFEFISYDNQRVIPIHYHEENEILFCKKGMLFIWIEGKKITLNENQLYFINKNIPHSTQAIEGSDIVVLYQKNDIFDEESVIINFEKSTDRTHMQEVTELIQTLAYMDKNKKDRFIKYKIQSELYNLNYHLLSYFSIKIDKETENKIKQNIKFNSILSTVNKNFTNQLNLTELSNLTGYSSAYLSRMFKKYTGRTFLDYKKSLSLERAIKLLDTTDYKIEEIAFLTGFANEKSMRTSFKKVLGITPIKYKMSKNDRK